MKFNTGAWIIPSWLLLGLRALGATLVGEQFATDPVAGNRFFPWTEGTQSAFIYNASNQNLTAVLDVDYSPAYFLSAPFAAVTDQADASFSFNFRITGIDTRVLPTAYIGLLTTNHVALGGDGLSLALSSSSEGVPAFSATVDQGPVSSGGESYVLATNVDYLAVGQYASSNREFVLEVFQGLGFTQRVGRSVARATNGTPFSVNRIGLQNSGGTAFHYTNGSITVVVDNLFSPAQPPVNLSINDTAVDEGNTGTTDAVFTVRLSSPSVQTVRVDYATEDLSGVAGVDFVARSGTLIFPPAATSASVSVPVIGNQVAQPDRTFRVVLSHGENGTIIAGTGVATIRDDDVCVVSVSDAAATEPAAGTAEAVFTVSLNLSNTQPVTVRFVASGGTAEAGVDFIAADRWITLAPGVTSLTCPVSVLADALDEPDETFSVTLSSATNAVTGRATGTGTILNSTPPPVIFLDMATSVVEGATAVATFHLTAPSARPVTAAYTTVDGTAMAGSDYLAASGTVTFAAGQTNASVTISTLSDAVHEDAEVFFLELTAATNAVPGNDHETITVLDDDSLPTIDITDTVVLEGNQGTTDASFEVTLSNPTAETVTVNYWTTNGTALAGEDYIATNGVLTFPPGMTSTQRVVVRVIGDVANETDETFGVLLDAPAHAALAKSQALCTIQNDDFVSLTISDAQAIEGDVQMQFVVSLSGLPAQQVTVHYATSDGTATGGSDYATNSGVLTFSTNTTQTITVGVLSDVLDEPNEVFYVTLTGAQNATIARSTGIGTIIDDDPSIINAGDITMSEGDSNITVFTFPVLLSSNSTNAVTVNFSTSNGTAIAGVDYVPTNGSVTFPPGTVSAEIRVGVLGDTLFESNEFFFVNLDSPVNATLGTVRAIGTIVNDDAPPPASIENIVILEGSCTNVVVTLAYTSAIPVVVRYCVTALPTNVFLVCDTNCGVAVPTNVAAACQARCCELVVPPGALSATFQLCVQQNGQDETNAVGSTVVELVGGPGRQVTNHIEVVNVDSPTLLSDGAEVVEGDDGITNLCFSIHLSRPLDTNVSVAFFTLDGTARAGADYLATNGTVVFAPGETVRTVCVPVLGDRIYEADETLYLVLSNAVNVSLPAIAFRGLIRDDDVPPALTISDATVIEGDTGVTMAVFTVSVLSPTFVGIDVEYIVNDGTATSGLDYIRGSGALHFDPGVSNLTILVPVLGDTLDEPDETFLVDLRNPVNATFERREGFGTIIDDDPPEIRVSNPAVLEGDAGGTNVLSFAVTLSSPGAVPVSVDYLTMDGTATAGLDYFATNGTLRIEPGQTSAVVTVRVIGERLPELNETLFLALTNPVAGTLPGPKGTGTILDDDAPCISVSSVVVQEQSGAPTSAVFQVTLDRPSTLEVAVSFSTSNGTAIAGIDYIAQSGTVIFPSGETNRSVAIVIRDDLVLEPAETFYLHLFNPINGMVCDSPGLGTILDGTLPPILFVAGAVVFEGNSGVTNAVFAATLNRPSAQTISFDFVTADASAVAGADYFARTGTVVFPAGTVSNFFTVPVIGDCLYEFDEAYLVFLSNPVSATLATGEAVGTILNDDLPPTITAEGVTVLEGDTGTTNAVFRLHVSCGSSQPISVNYVTLDGTARAGSDYVATNGSVVFPAGATEVTISVPVIGDLEVEPDEDFQIVLSNPVGAALGSGAATGIILDDDGILIGIEPARGNEGSTAVFVLTLSRPASSEVTVQLTTADDTAIAGLDYVPTNVLVRFPAGVTRQTQGVYLLTDDILEPDETFYAILSNPTHARLGTDRALGTILDGTLPCLSIFDAAVQENGSGQQSVVFSVTLNFPSPATVCVHYATTNGTAIAGPDFVAVEGILCFPPGTTNGQVVVQILPNTRDETNEFFFVVLFDPTHATLCKGSASATIINPLVTNAPPTIVLAAVAPCLTLPTNLTLSATAFDPDGLISRVEFFDFTNRLGETLAAPFEFLWLNVPPGLHRLTAVAVDNVGARATSAPVMFQASFPAELSIDDQTVVEGNSGITDALFTLSLSSASCHTVTVEVTTFDGTATAGSDYLAARTTIVFLPGETRKPLPVAVLGDTVIEPDETFLVCLSNVSNATLSRPCGVGTILNDDFNRGPSVALDAVAPCLMLPASLILTATATDPDGSVARVEFFDSTNLLGVCSAAPFTVTWTNVPAGHHLLTAVAVDNLGARATSAPVTFSASFPAALTIDDRTVVEGNSGFTDVRFTLSLALSSCRTVSVDVATADGTAIAGSDYVALQAHVTFLPGEIRKSILVPVIGDTEVEPDETFFVCLSNVSGATLPRTCGIGTIINDDTNIGPSVALAAVAPCLTLPTNLTLIANANDPDGFISRVEFFEDTTLLGASLAAPFQFTWTNVPPGNHLVTAVALDNRGARATSGPVAFSASFPAALTIDDRTVVEGNSGITNALFTLSLSTSSCLTVTAEIRTFKGTATAGTDFLAVTTNVVFLPGETRKSIIVPVIGDTEIEPDETFFVCLKNVTGATLVRPCGMGTILNDDTNIGPSVALAAVTPCLMLPANLVLTATASDPDGFVSRVIFFDDTTLLGASLAAPFQFTWTNVPPGNHLVTAVAVDNRGARATSDPVAFSASFPATLTIDDRTVVEGNSGITNALFTLSLSTSNCLTVTADITTFDGTATAGSDYLALTTNVVFLPGETRKSIIVPVIGDTEIEPDETFFVCLNNVSGATLTRPCGMGTILNDDTNIGPSVALAAVAPCLMLPANLVLTATASDSDGFVSRVEFFDGTTLLGASLAAPFQFTWTNVPPGNHLVTAVAVDNRGDRATSGPVSFSASFPAALTIDDRTVVEGNSGITNALFTLSLSASNCLTVTADITTFDGTATAGSDYLALTTNVVFLPGETRKSIIVPVIGDTEIEPDETFFVCLNNVSGATLTRPCGMGTILNDDTNVAPSVALAAVAPCLMLPANLVLTATASDPDGFVSRVEFFEDTTLLGASLAAPFQFTWTNVPPGNHFVTAVAVDNRGERATSGPVSFSASFPAALTIDDRTVVEGNSGITNALFTLSLSTTNCLTVTADVVTFDGTATGGSDYLAVTTHVVFLPGEMRKTIIVPVVGDTEIEPDETFFVCLNTVSGATVPRTCGIGTILNDDTNIAPSVALGAVAPCLLLPANLVLTATASDPDGFVSRVEFFEDITLLGASLAAPFQFTWTNVPPGNHRVTAVAVDNRGDRATSGPVAFSASFPAALTIDDQTVVEGNSGVTNVIFTLSLSSSNCLTVSADVATLDGSATAGSDYVAVTTNVVFLPGEMRKSIVVPVIGDTEIEPDETFFVCLSHVNGATLPRNCGIGTIINDDTNAPPHVALAAIAPCVTVPTDLTLTAMPADSDGVISRVDFYDYSALLGTCVAAPFEFHWQSVPAGDHLITAVAVDNRGAQATSGPVAFSASVLAALTINDRSVVEGNAGITEALFTLTLSAASCHTVTVDVATSDGTATAGSDYFAVRTNFTFLPGETQKTFSVAVLGDTVIEPDETFFVCLSNVTHATLPRPCGLGTILNDDIPCSPNLDATPMPDQTRCVCDEVLFSTTVTTQDPVTFVWKFKGNVLPGQTNNSLLLQSLKPGQAGLYTVEISTPCASNSRSATLTLQGAGNLNPVSFTNNARITIFDHAVAVPYPSSNLVLCLPGPIKHLSVTLDGLSHSFPDDLDILLVSPAGQSIKLMSDAGGNTTQRLTNVVLTFTDTATTSLPDATRIASGTYRPTDYETADAFVPPAPQATATNFTPFIGTDPNGFWTLYILDDKGGDAGVLLNGWYLTIEWQDTVPYLSSPALLPDGRFAVTLSGLPHMTHVLEASSDLMNWTPVATNTLAAPSVLLFDARPGRDPYRFYRAVRCP